MNSGHPNLTPSDRGKISEEQVEGAVGEPSRPYVLTTESLSLVRSSVVPEDQ